ncbi:MAG: T9SS type A sorting domain-containing protein [bacterium]|nr:T9SS type A sorting domain-containing protein [bacterium]
MYKLMAKAMTVVAIIWLPLLSKIAVAGWEKTYGGPDSDRGYSVAQTLDGGYIITGYTYSFGAGFGNVYLIKVNSTGDTIWTKTYSGTDDDYGNSVAQTKDSGYIIAGATHSYGAGGFDVYLIKVDAQGVEETIKSEIRIPDDEVLEVYPNPFRKKTVIRAQGLGRGLINQTPTLQIYDLTGRLVKSFSLITPQDPSDNHLSLITAVSWDGTDLAGNEVESGVYFCKLIAGDNSITKKIIVIR